MAEWHNPVLMSADVVTEIPIRENDEPMVDLRGGPVHTRLAFESHGVAGCRVRQGVAERLTSAAKMLPRVSLALAQGYRSPSEQQMLFDRYRQSLLRTDAELDDAEADRMATRHVAQPRINAPHTTGAAIDITLINAGGVLLDMGTPIDATPEESGLRCYTNHPDISQVALENRQLLAAALGAAGFVNYPTEWWHWSYGDRYWAYSTGASHALYGPVEMA